MVAGQHMFCYRIMRLELVLAFCIFKHFATIKKQNVNCLWPHWYVVQWIQISSRIYLHHLIIKLPKGCNFYLCLTSYVVFSNATVFVYQYDDCISTIIIEPIYYLYKGLLLLATRNPSKIQLLGLTWLSFSNSY